MIRISTVDERLKKHYRRFQGFLMLFLACILGVGFFAPRLHKSHPGPVLLTLMGVGVGVALWGRWRMRRDGVLPGEFKDYCQSQPMMIVAQAFLFVFTVAKAIQWINGW